MSEKDSDICRVCLETSSKMYPLVGTILNVDENVATMITYCTSIEITLDEDLPKAVCIPCFRTIRIAYNFIRQFKDTNKKLLEERDRMKTELKFEPQLDNVSQIFQFEGQNVDEIFLQKNEEEIQEEIILTYVEDTLENDASMEELKIIEDEAGISDIQKLDGKTIEIDIDNSVYRPVRKRKTMKRYTCPVCSKVFVLFEAGFVKHLFSHEGEVIHCSKCLEQGEYNVDSYIQHYRKVHLFQCNICNKSFEKKSSLGYHVKIHNDGKLFTCLYQNCTKSFLTASSLRKHLHTHSNIAKYVCSKCGGKFKTYDTFRYHQKTHDGKRSHLCTQCGRTFLQSVHLKYHMWKHTGYKQFQCEDCDKSYTSQTQLKKHRRKFCGVKKEQTAD